MVQRIEVCYVVMLIFKMLYISNIKSCNDNAVNLITYRMRISQELLYFCKTDRLKSSTLQS